MSQLLAYSQEDAITARQQLDSLGGPQQVACLGIDRRSDSQSLAEQIGADVQSVTLIVSRDFLTNPNCLFRLGELLSGAKTVICRYTEEATALRQLDYRTELLHHWQDRYLQLRRDSASYTEEQLSSFEHYLAKVRSISVELEGLSILLLQQRSAPLLTPPKPPMPMMETPDTDATDADHPLPETSDALITAAHERWDRGDKNAAIKLLRRGVERYADSADIRYQLTLSLALDGQQRLAVEKMEELLREYPQHHDGLMLSGELHLQAGDHQRARTEWDTLMGLAPGYPTLRERMGLLLAEHYPQEAGEALRYLHYAVKQANTDAYTLYRYAELLYRSKAKRKKAEKWVKRALESDPDLAAAHYLLAVLLHRRGKTAAAGKHYRTAVTLQPAYRTAANDQAFAGAASPPADSKETATLSALKQNVAELEEMLRQRTKPAPAAPQKGSGRTVLISGATSGIGRATAVKLASEGFTIVALGRRKDRLSELKKELKERYAAKVYPVVMDVRNRSAVAGLMNQLPEKFGHIDILINNAGKAKGFDPIQSGDIDHWEEMIDVNLKGLLYLTRAVTPHMVARGEGMVINVCSTAGKEVYPNGNVYCATKHAVDALTYAMRLDLVKHGVRVGQVCPAHVEETEFAVVRFDGDRERAKIYEDFQPLRSSDVAEAIHFMVTQPRHVNILDMVLQGTQQASSTVVDRSGRNKYTPEEE